MSRASEDDLRALVSSDPSLSVSIFIDTASSLIDKVESCDTANELSAKDLRLIETWLAAHFYAIRDQQYQAKTTEGASATFQGQTGMYLDSTQWGQQAITLDITQCLAKINAEAKEGGKRTASLEWLGKPPSEQIDYVDRD